MTGLPWKPSRLPLILTLGTLVLGLAGCSDGYPPDMTYEVRDDLLVIERPTKDPTRLDQPGQFGQLAQELQRVSAESNSGKLFDPNQIPRDVRDKIGLALKTHFGTPAAPIVAGIDDAAFEKIEAVSDFTGIPESLDTSKLGYEPGSEISAVLQLGAPTFDAASPLAKGSLLYRRHCLHCHGLTGNGRGPTAPWVNPHPRDYRQGKFKFVSTDGVKVPSRKPSRQDLLRVLRQGVDGTSMPAFGAISGAPFGVLPDSELEALASYVIHLSIRGQAEFDTMKEWNNDNSIKVEEVVARLAIKIAAEWARASGSNMQIIPSDVKPDATQEKDLAALVASAADLKDPAARDAWRKAEVEKLKTILTSRPFTEEGIRKLVGKLVDDVRTPDVVEGPLTERDIEELTTASLQASIKRGHAEYIKACASCHKDYGRKIDNLLWDDWGTIVRPYNLTLGAPRGGRRPVDLYWRIYAGIPGANMAGNEKALTTPDGQTWPVWDVVNFVEAAPYRKMLPPDIAQKIYPQH